MPQNTARIIDLEDRHVDEAVALSANAGWNQAAADWWMMLACGQGIGIEDDKGRLAATSVVLPYGDGFGWISMVLVAAHQRGRGLARQLVERAVAMLGVQGLAAMVDATPAGEAVYRPMGFEPGLRLQRWSHECVQIIELDSLGVNVAEKLDPEIVAGLDEAIFGGKRHGILEYLAQRSAAFCAHKRDGTGFVLGRDGNVAHQIGPVSAQSPRCAAALLDHALRNLSGPVFIDAFDHQTSFVAQLARYGFKPQRPFRRMSKGSTKSYGQPENMYAMAGPELG